MAGGEAQQNSRMAQPSLQVTLDLFDDIKEQYHSVCGLPSHDEAALRDKAAALKDIRNRADDTTFCLIGIYGRMGSIEEKKQAIQARALLLQKIHFEIGVINEALTELNLDAVTNRPPESVKSVAPHTPAAVDNVRVSITNPEHQVTPLDPPLHTEAPQTQDRNAGPTQVSGAPRPASH